MAQIVAGVDTHKDTHYAAVISLHGEHLSAVQFPATKAGYQALTAFITCQGELLRVGIEGTNSYGAGLTRHLQARNIEVVEVIRPAKVVRRMKGKSDAIDAYTAAHTALTHQDVVTPKTSIGTVEAIRVIHAGRRSALKAHAEVITQIKSLLVTAPEKVRAQYQSLSTKKLVGQLAASHTHVRADCVETATRSTLKRLAKRYIHLDEEITICEGELQALVEQVDTALTAVRGVSTIIASQLLITAGDNPERLHSEAAFAALCGVSPLPASSGQTNRFRLNRGGNRAANSALYQIALVRMASDPMTKTYVAKRTADGKTKKEILRCLKRAIAREVFHLLTNPQPVIHGKDLRAFRLEIGLTLTAAAQFLDCDLNRLSRLERGITKDQKRALEYQKWLTDYQQLQTLKTVA